MIGGVRALENLSDFQAWCWQQKKHSFSNSELFSLAHQLTSKKEISRNELAQQLRKALSPANKTAPPPASRAPDAQAQRELEKAMREAPPDNKTAGNKSPSGMQVTATSAQPSRKKLFQKVARAILRESGANLPERQRTELQQDIPAIQGIDGLNSFVEKLQRDLQLLPQKKCGPASDRKPTDTEHSDGIPGGDRKGDHNGNPIMEADADSALPADRFSRFPGVGNDRKLFDGIQTRDTDDLVKPDDGGKFHAPYPPALLDTVMDILRRNVPPQNKVSPRTDGELSQDELSRMLEELLRLNILSPTFSDTFLVNQDRAAYLLAKQAYLRMQGLFTKKHPLQKGTHISGSRGLQEVQPDKTRRTGHLSSRIAAYHTLRRGLRRRALSPYAPLLDEDDLIEFASRKKVGYSVALALDVSGAVQFGRRIQAVRRACMAFCYYSKRFHPHDRVHCVTYHETAREIKFSEVPRLRSINGAGKDIGNCLRKCREILRQDPDRVPVVILIGDGLPAHGDRAGFYRFMENNRDYIEKAFEHARLLRKEGCLFTFLQFREDRHLWQEYADGTAQQITREAGGVLCRIDSPADMAVSLVESFQKLKSGKFLFRENS